MRKTAQFYGHLTDSGARLAAAVGQSGMAAEVRRSISGFGMGNNGGQRRRASMARDIVLAI